MNKQVCMYDGNCYRKNPQHFKDFLHPKQDAEKQQKQQQQQQQQQQQPPPPPPPAPVPVPVPVNTNQITNTTNNVPQPPQQPDQHQQNHQHASPAKKSSIAPRRSVSASPMKSNGANNTKDSFIARPEPRSSPLKGSNDPAEVYEMAFPKDEMQMVLDVAKRFVSSPHNNNSKSQNPLRIFPGLVLVGPFDVMLNGARFESDRRKWMQHRQPLHPPEAQTFAYVEPSFFTEALGIQLPKSNNNIQQQLQQHHDQQRRDRNENGDDDDGGQERNDFASWPTLCFFRDDPEEQPCCVASFGLGGRDLKPLHQSFSRVICYMLRQYLSAGGNNNGQVPPPPMTLLVRDLFSHVFKGKENEMTQIGREMSAFDKDRGRKAIAKTMNGMGIVVPYDKQSEVGYRPPHLSKQQLTNLLTKMNNGTNSAKDRSDLDEQLRWADIANDESDFGMGLEIGLNFLYLSKLDAQESKILNGYVFSNSVRMLDICYDLLMRDVYKHIVSVEAFTYRYSK